MASRKRRTAPPLPSVTHGSSVRPQSIYHLTFIHYPHVNRPSSTDCKDLAGFYRTLGTLEKVPVLLRGPENLP